MTHLQTPRGRSECGTTGPKTADIQKVDCVFCLARHLAIKHADGLLADLDIPKDQVDWDVFSPLADSETFFSELQEELNYSIDCVYESGVADHYDSAFFRRIERRDA